MTSRSAFARRRTKGVPTEETESQQRSDGRAGPLPSVGHGHPTGPRTVGPVRRGRRRELGRIACFGRWPTDTIRMSVRLEFGADASQLSRAGLRPPASAHSLQPASAELCFPDRSGTEPTDRPRPLTAGRTTPPLSERSGRPRRSRRGRSATRPSAASGGHGGKLPCPMRRP